MRHAIQSAVSFLRSAFRRPDRTASPAASRGPAPVRESRKCDVIIGLDFGTSCTKVVVRTPYERNRAFAVPFGSAAHHSSPYLLPSAIWIGQEGGAYLTKHDKTFYLKDIKTHLMHAKAVSVTGGHLGDRTLDPRVVAVAFLALALRVIRRWFIGTHGEVYGQFSIDWQFNLGLPSADFADSSLCRDYLQVAAAAWSLSVQNHPIGTDTAQRALSDVTIENDEATHGVGGFVDCDGGEPAEVKLIPEVAAEVAGYARSHMRDEGLHILMDVGATTLDVCSFILHEREGEDCYELLTADVRELGALVLHRNRLAVARERIPASELSALLDCDPVAPVPDAIEVLLSAFPSLKRELLVGSDEHYRKRCSQMIWETLVALKTRRDPRSSRWKSEMPVFSAGGACGMAFYCELIDGISGDLARMYPPCTGILALSLAKPENLEADVNDEGYHRLAVAWGLSYPDTDIGSVTRPCDIADIPPRRQAEPARPYVSKEMV